MGMYVTAPSAPENRVFERVRTRKLDRSVAHERMKKAKMQHVNKHEYAHYKTMTGMDVSERLDSYFSQHWREVANEKMKDM